MGHLVLLVEDNELNRDMLTRRLTRKGYEVKTAEDGLKALELAASEPFDVILMDMNIPEIDGWTCSRKIKDDPNTAAIPIIALTAHAMRGEREKALAAGCDEYESKPVKLPELLEKIKSLIERRQAA